MYERMLGKKEPSENEIEETLGEGRGTLINLEKFLQQNYSLVRELKNPFGSKYGWGYKYSHRSSHLCYAFFEKGAITVTVQIGDRLVPALEARLDKMMPKTKELWQKRYPCGSFGGWVHYRILNETELKDVCELIKIKKAPIKKD